MSTPSAPSSKAFRTNCGSTRPEHMTRITRRVRARTSRRAVPARSTAVYVHQLQKNATIRGSNAVVAMAPRYADQHAFDLGHDLARREVVLLGGAATGTPRRTCRSPCTAPR